jgi:hypothetical protein
VSSAVTLPDVLPTVSTPVEAYTEAVNLDVAAARAVHTRVAMFAVTDEATATSVSLAAKKAADRLKTVDATRKRLAKPINEAKQLIQDTYNPAINAWQEVIDLCKSKVQAFITAESERKRALEAAAEAAHRAAAPVAEVAALVTAASEPVKVEGMTTRDVWSAAVVDLPSLLRAVADGRAPADFVIVNGAGIDRYVNATRGTAPIPGVRIDRGTEVRRTGR